MFRQISLIVFLAFCCVVASVSNTVAGQSKNGTGDDDVAASSSIAPPFVTPGKDLFVTREGDPFVVTVTAPCLLEDDSDGLYSCIRRLSQREQGKRLRRGHRRSVCYSTARRCR